jgi:hypothetical protein
MEDVKKSILTLLNERIENSENMLGKEKDNLEMKAYWLGINVELKGILRIVENDEF